MMILARQTRATTTITNMASRAKLLETQLFMMIATLRFKSMEALLMLAHSIRICCE
ncbi:MAG: hypothetical protein U0905_22375 [Pirellulales bacterium]